MAVSILGSGVSPVAGARTLNTISSVSYTFGNGLTESSNHVVIGGTLTGNTTIDGAYDFRFGTSTLLNKFDARCSDTLYLETEQGGSSQSMEFDGSHMEVTDVINSKGLQYAGDYTGNFTEHSLVTKGFVEASGTIDHNDTTNYDANEHIDHSAVTITVAGTANEISSSAGAQTIAASRTWTIGIADNAAMPGTDAMIVPVGTTAQRSTTTAGAIRYNSTTGYLESYYGAAWNSLAHQAGAFHDGFSDYDPDEHINWTNATDNLITTGYIQSSNASGVKTDIITERTAANGVDVDGVTLKDGGITLLNGSATVNKLENSVDTLDDTSDTAIPTSKAVGDYVATELSAATNSGILVARQVVLFSDDATPLTIVTLNADDKVWDIKMYVETTFDDSGIDAMDIGKDANGTYFVNDTSALSSTGWRTFTWSNDPEDEAPYTGSTDITCEYNGQNSDATQGKAIVYVWYSQF